MSLFSDAGRALNRTDVHFWCSSTNVQRLVAVLNLAGGHFTWHGIRKERGPTWGIGCRSVADIQYFRVDAHDEKGGISNSIRTVLASRTVRAFH